MKSKIIYGCEGRGDADEPYLTRTQLLLNASGSLDLHVFHRSDHDVFHDHPGGYVSLILWRGYVEVTPEGRSRKWPGMVLFRRAEWKHRVELVGGSAVTLVWRWKKRREWGFWTVGKWEHWRAYFDRMGC